MNFFNNFSIRGNVEITLKDNGVPIKVVRDHNLVVIDGRKLVVKAISGKNRINGVPFYINQIGVGERGGAAPVDSNTSLLNPLIKNLNEETDIVITDANPDRVVFTHTISLKDFSGISEKTIQEAGLFYQENGQTKLFSRYVFPQLSLVFNSEHDISATIVWTISVPARLN